MFFRYLCVVNTLLKIQLCIPFPAIGIKNCLKNMLKHKIFYNVLNSSVYHLLRILLSFLLMVINPFATEGTLFWGTVATGRHITSETPIK